MTISELRNRLRYVKHGGVPLPLLRSGIRSGTRGGTASGRVRGDLRITVRASPSGVPHPSSTPQPAGVPLDRTGASAEWGTPLVSFGAPPDDQMSITASKGELCLSGHDDSAALPLSGVVALSEPDPEMTAMLSWATENSRAHVETRRQAQVEEALRRATRRWRELLIGRWCPHHSLLAHTCTVLQAVGCTQGPDAQALLPTGPSGQLGKEQTRANAEDSVNLTARLT